MDNNVLRVKDFCDRHNDYAAAGNEIFNISRPMIEKGESIVFDMIGIDSVSTVFLNTSFGHLIDVFGLVRVKQSFKFTHILRSQIERIKKYFSDYAECLADNDN